MFKLTLIAAITLYVSFSVHAEENKKSNPPKALAASKEMTFAKVPPLKKGEYAVFVQDKYVTFTTRTYETLELDAGCFKANKPECEAYVMAKTKPKDIENLGGATNIAAVNCELMNGRNLIATDYQKNEHNFCRYRDGSFVNSWSMFQLHNPVQKVK